MIKSYLITAFRSLWRRKGFSAINILGLTLGLTIFLLIMQYANFELSYDQHYPDCDRLYRIGLEQYQNGELIEASAENYPALGPALKNDFPEVESYARLYNLGAKNNVVVTYQDGPEKIAFKQKKLLYASDSFLPLFSFSMLAGDRDEALSEPFKMVISESTARKYFGTEVALGKYLRLQDDDFNDELCEVTGVVKDVPANAHLKFDILVSYSTLFVRYNGAPRARARFDQSWERKDMYTYVKLADQKNAFSLVDKFAAFIRQHIPNLEEKNREDHFILQSVTDIHLYSHLNNEPELNGSGTLVYFLSIIAMIVLLIAYVNYINLSTARSIERANEVGVRKVLGASGHQLVSQFLIESVLINLCAILLSLVLYLSLFGRFSKMVTNLSDEQFWTFALWNHFWFVPMLLLLLVIGSVLSGLYPAFVLSRFKPLRILGKKINSDSGSNLLRKGLVLFQFAVCIILLIGTFIVYQQMSFMRSVDLGFNPKQVVVVEQPSIFTDFESRTQSIKNFKTEVARQASITDVMSTLVIPGRQIRWKVGVRRLQETQDDSHVFNYNLIDENFIDGFDMEILAGRNFSDQVASDRDTGCIITLLASQKLGFASPEEAIGQTITSDDLQDDMIIVGVVNDYHQESLKAEIEPTIFLLNDYAEYYLMRIETGDMANSLAIVESTWKSRFPGNPFQYFFLDDYFNAQYQNEIRFQKLFVLFALLAMFVACLGLFGLSAFIAQQRIREISIRKVLGAGVTQLILLLTIDFTKIILIANLIAWPVVASVMQTWLEEFALRVSLNIGIFLAAGTIVLVLGIITVSYHAFRAAMAHPAEILATE